MESQFREQSVVVVGAGSGLGRQYCLDLAKHGARVLLAGRSSTVHQVAREIRQSGGTAMSVIADAMEGQYIIDSAIKAFGNVNALIVNAGITRDRSFRKMSTHEWDEVMSVHLGGAFACTKAAWAHFVGAGGGHILLTTSGAAFHGNFGQANYSAAKGAIIGLTKSLAIEGKKYGIKVNAIAPMASTEMTKDIFTDTQKTWLRAELVSPVALWLVHPGTEESGTIIECGGGWASALRWQRSKGARWGDITLEKVLRDGDEVLNFEQGYDFPTSTEDSLMSAEKR